MQNIIENKNVQIIVSLLVALVVILAVGFFRDKSEIITNKELQSLIESNRIEKVIKGEEYISLKTDKKVYKILTDGVDIKKLSELFPIEIEGDKARRLLLTFVFVGIVVVVIVSIVMFFFRNKLLDEYFVDSKYTGIETDDIFVPDIEPIKSDVNFSDVAGMRSVKEELEEIIDFLANPQKYIELDIRLPKGLLLVGPPGVGKTLIAKALAGEARVPFFYQSGANIVEIYVGMGAKKIHQLFQSAKRRAPSIIFIDEIDAVGKSRGKNGLGNDEREATLNQLLTEMDGFDSNSGVIVIGATNRLDVLDGAILRPGRFDRRVFISLPDIKEREEILKIYLRKKPHNVDIKRLALSTVGFSAAALSTLVNEAALFALKMGKNVIESNHFDEVKDKVISGKKRIISFSDEERNIQAVYQSGKALVATWLGVHYDRIGIVTTMFQEIDREIISKNEMLNRIKVYLAGNVATWEVFGEKYSNGAEDLLRAMKEAKLLIEDYRMSEEIIPATDEVESLILKSYEDVRVIITKLSVPRKKIEEYLLEYENISENRAKKILNELF